MDGRASPVRPVGQKEPPPPEPPKYIHDQVLERLNVYENSEILVDAKEYYIQKYGMLVAPLTGLLQSEKANMITKQEMIEAISLLDLEPSETGLFWIAQMLYLLPFPLFWSIHQVKSDRGTTAQFTFKFDVNLPPSIVYLDGLVESIRASEYKDVEKTSKVKYVYMDKKHNRHEVYTDDDILQTYELDRQRVKHQRPSLRHFWLNVMNAEAQAKLYGYPETTGDIVFPDTEKAIQSTYTSYKPTGMIEEQKMEQFWITKQNRELAEKRETEEFIHFMKDWASAKQRFESELIRKNGQSYSGSNYEKRAFRLNTKVTIQNPRQFSAQTRLVASGMVNKPSASILGASTMAGSAPRPMTGATVYLRTTKIPPNSIYRKASAKNFVEDYRKKLKSGGYRDQHRKPEIKAEDSQESSLEIEEDKDELDEKNENLLSQIDKQYKKGQLPPPQVVDATGVNKTLRAVRTATYSDRKDIKYHEGSALVGVASKNTLENVIHLEENIISQKKLQQVRSTNKFLSTTGDENSTTEAITINPIAATKSIHRTMSVYGQKERPHEIIERPFTAIMQSDNLKFARNNDLREVDNIKKRFNRYELNVPLSKIEAALICPEINQVFDPSKIALPSAGAGLLSNPAFEKKKKKKKGKKKDTGKSKSRGRK